MERGININEILPPDAFLATRYFDPQRNFITRRIYYDNGLVEAFDGNEWWTVCRFTPSQTEIAKKSIIESRLSTTDDLINASVYDPAVLTYAWRIHGKEGIVTNWAYPAVEHPAFEKLETELDEVEKNCAPYQD